MLHRLRSPTTVGLVLGIAAWIASACASDDDEHPAESGGSSSGGSSSAGSDSGGSSSGGSSSGGDPEQSGAPGSGGGGEGGASDGEAGNAGAGGAAPNGGSGGAVAGSAGATLLPCGGPDLGSGEEDESDGATTGAVSLDGTNWVSVSKAGNYAPESGFTWEAWFQGSNLPTDTTPGNMDASHAGQMLFVVADGQGCVDVNLGLGGTYRAPAELSLVVDGPGGCGARDTTPVHYLPPGGFENGRSYHVAGVRDYEAKCVGLYLDGVLVASKTSELDPIQAAGFAASIGRWTDGGYDRAHFEGVIDEVLVYGRPLSAAEISRHFNGGLGRTTPASDPGLVAGWHLDETTGSIAADFGPDQLDGTYDNAPSHVDGLVSAQ